MFKVSRRCYCAFCRSPRMVYAKKHVSAFDGFLSIAASALLSLIIWQDLDPRAVIFFALGLGFAEIFIMIRWRLSVSCTRCGFDPVLYKKSPDRAAKLVKAYMEERRKHPSSALTPPPKLPVIRKRQASEAGTPR